jgi:beta-N-acetylhexosaminidase
MSLPMSTTIASLAKAPFYLDAAAIDWVRRTHDSLSLRGKLAQLQNVLLLQPTDDDLDQLAQIQPGAVTHLLLGDLAEVRDAVTMLNRSHTIPLLHSADVEGGAFSANGCTPMPNQLGMAAMGSADLYDQAVGVMASEVAALGINWSFSPVLDINHAFRSAIVSTRSFGSDQQQIERLSQIHIHAMQSHGVAATAKHWPGEGFDDRDQHLVTTINPLELDNWRASFGKLYAAAIESGVLSVMSAHIAWPAYALSKGVIGLETCRPASLSRLLNLELLRGELGFNGLIVSDATRMAGMYSWGPREKVLPELIENGCDMILFPKDIEGELRILSDAVADGRLSMKRVDDAVLRVLGFKAALGLHKAVPLSEGHGQTAGWSSALATAPNLAVGEAVAAASPTLIKDVQGLLPISPQRHRRVVLVTEPYRHGVGGFEPQPLHMARLLEERGFDVSAYDSAKPPQPGEADLIIYVLAQESLFAKSNIYLDWVALLGSGEVALDRSWYEIPTLLISFGQPYYLYDAPRMPCVINAYSAVEPVQRAVVRKLLGEEAFTGVSPVDAFCGLPDATY